MNMHTFSFFVNGLTFAIITYSMYLLGYKKTMLVTALLGGLCFAMSLYTVLA